LLGGAELHLADPDIGIAFAFAVASLSTLAIAMAGYASNNKYAMLGGLRAIARTIAYEIPLVLAGAAAVLLAGSLRPGAVVAAQAEPLVTVAGLTVPSWFAFVDPLGLVLFAAAALAEVWRNPFDIPEAAQEIVAGYRTEYGGVYFALVYAAEFVHIFLAGALAATLFLAAPPARCYRPPSGSSSRPGPFSCSLSGRGPPSPGSGSTRCSGSAGRSCSWPPSPTSCSRRSSSAPSRDRGTRVPAGPATPDQQPTAALR
jgi:hypothetical protein